MGSRLARGVTALLVSVVFVWLAFRDLDVDAVRASLAALGWLPMGVYLISLFAIHLLRTARWHLMVRALHPEQPVFRSLRISFLGFAAVFLVPLRLGELARPWLLRQASDVPMSAGLGTVAVERTVDGLFMVLVLVLSVLWSGASDPILWTMGGVAGAIFGGAGTAFAWMAIAPRSAERFWRWVFAPLGASWADRVIALLNGFVEGLSSLPNWSARHVLGVHSGLLGSERLGDDVPGAGDGHRALACARLPDHGALGRRDYGPRWTREHRDLPRTDHLRADLFVWFRHGAGAGLCAGAAPPTGRAYGRGRLAFCLGFSSGSCEGQRWVIRGLMAPAQGVQSRLPCAITLNFEPVLADRTY